MLLLILTIRICFKPLILMRWMYWQRKVTGLTAESIRFNRSRYFPPSNTLMLNFTVTVKSVEAHPNHEVDAWRWFGVEEAREAVKPNSLARAFLLGWLDGEYHFPEYRS